MPATPRTIVEMTGHPSQHTPRLDALLGMLETHTLDPRFEAYGNFIYPHRQCRSTRNPVTRERVYEDVGPMDPEHPGDVHVWGNFFDYSYAFSIITDEPEVVERLTTAIRANQATDRYRAALSR